MCLSASELVSNPWHSLGCNCVTMVSASVFTWHAACISLFEFPLAKVPIIRFGPTVLQYDRLLSYLQLQNPGPK